MNSLFQCSAKEILKTVSGVYQGKLKIFMSLTECKLLRTVKYILRVMGSELTEQWNFRECISLWEKLSVKRNKSKWMKHSNVITPWPQSTRELYRQSGRRRSAKLVPTFADRGVSRGQRNGSPQPLISDLAPYILLNIFLSKITRACNVLIAVNSNYCRKRPFVFLQ